MVLLIGSGCTKAALNTGRGETGLTFPVGGIKDSLPEPNDVSDDDAADVADSGDEGDSPDEVFEPPPAPPVTVRNVVNTLTGTRPVIPAPASNGLSNAGSYVPIAVSGNSQFLVPRTETVAVPAVYNYAAVRAVPRLTKQSTVVDPYADLPDPDIDELGLPTMNGGRPVIIDGSSVVTLSPGIYDSLTVSALAKVRLEPGTYVIRKQLLILGKANVTGDDVQFIFPSRATNYNYSKSVTALVDRLEQVIMVKDTAVLTLHGPKNPEKQGIAFWMRGLTCKIAFRINVRVAVTGVLYAPGCNVMLNGNSRVSFSRLVANSVRLIGGTGKKPPLSQLKVGELPLP